MYRELNEILECPTGSRRLVVSRDVRSDSGFVIHCVLASYLRRGHHVILVNVGQTTGHYHRAALKSGLNLKSGEFRLRCVDFLGEWGTAATPDLRSLYHRIKRLAAEGSQSLLVVDDVSAFLNLGSTATDVAAFAHYCAKLPLLAASLFGAFESDGDRECRRLLALLRHWADMSIQVGGLQTGRSQDVHGQIGFVDKKSNRVFQYKLEEKKVCILPVGTSAAVL